MSPGLGGGGGGVKEGVVFHRIGEVYLVLASVSLFKYLLCFVCCIHFTCSPLSSNISNLLSRNFAFSICDMFILLHHSVDI
jgi:hypothetical protein